MTIFSAKTLLATCATLLYFSAPAHAIVIVVGNTDAHECFLAAKANENPSGGIAACDSALKNESLNPHDRAATLVNRAALKIELNQINDFIADYDSSIAIQPNLADAYVDRAIALIMLRRFDEALADVNRSIELGPTHPYIGYYNRAVVEQMSGKFKEAYFDYQKALEIEPDFVAAAERLNDFVVIEKPASISASGPTVPPPER